MLCKMNHDQQIILAAYDDAIKRLYAALFGQYVEAAGDSAQLEQADQHFMAGLALARRARDRAVALAS